MNILKVPISELPQAWAIALPILRRANSVGEEMDEEEVLHDLRKGLRQLWLGEYGSFGCLTEIRQDENTRYALVYMCGGVRIREWYLDLYLYLYAWARAQGADSLQIHFPRPGWKRLLSSLGFTELDQDTLIKEIA